MYTDTLYEVCLVLRGSVIQIITIKMLREMVQFGIPIPCIETVLISLF